MPLLNITRPVPREGVSQLNWYSTAEEAIAAAYDGPLGLDKIIIKKSGKYTWTYIPPGAYEFTVRLIEMLGCTFESSIFVMK